MAQDRMGLVFRKAGREIAFEKSIGLPEELSATR
jgi:hypothetical protein